MEPTAVNCRGISSINCQGIVKPAVVNCRRIFSSFNGVFQPYQMCEHQISYRKPSNCLIHDMPQSMRLLCWAILNRFCVV